MLASALCLIISPNRVNASRLCQSRPVTGFIARRRDLLRVMAHTARTLVCPGGCPYCWYALFQGTARDLWGPLTVLPKKRLRVNTLNLKNSQNIFSDPAECGPAFDDRPLGNSDPRRIVSGGCAVEEQRVDQFPDPRHSETAWPAATSPFRSARLCACSRSSASSSALGAASAPT